MNLQKDRKRKDNKGRGVHINKTATLLVLFCLCIGGISMIAAKYIKQTDTKDNSAVAKGFYFESDLLDGTTHEIVPTENGAASVTIQLRNYVDELRYSETDIKYTVSVTEEGTENALEDTNIENKTGTISTGDKNSADVTLSNLQEGKSYTVTATTDNTYQKTLTGTIRVAESDTSVHATVSNNTDQYIEVTVWTVDSAGPVTLTSRDTGLIPDNTDTLMSGKATGEDITIPEGSWGVNTSHVFRFFKTTDNASKTYQATVNETEVTVSAQ